MSNFNDPITGEVKELRTDVQAKEAYLRLKWITAQVDKEFKKVKAFVVEELHRNSGKPIVFADGSTFSLVSRAAKRTVDRRDWLDSVGGDQDKADLGLEVNVTKAENLLKRWVKEGEAVDPAKFKESIKATYTVEYPKYEGGDNT